MRTAAGEHDTPDRQCRRGPAVFLERDAHTFDDRLPMGSAGASAICAWVLLRFPAAGTPVHRIAALVMVVAPTGTVRRRLGDARIPCHCARSVSASLRVAAGGRTKESVAPAVRVARQRGPTMVPAEGRAKGQQRASVVPPAKLSTPVEPIRFCHAAYLHQWPPPVASYDQEHHAVRPHCWRHHAGLRGVRRD